MRALRVLIACLWLMLPAAPSRAAPVVADTVLVVSYATAAQGIGAAERDAPRAETEAPAPGLDIALATRVAIPLAPPSRPASPLAVPVADRWLVHCALLC
ncbi:hypothetical protein [Polyangium aurulentum]|uniref:hypothetical protein n=1 Tax=Polyangium aurulentum TaxID=2567896 RepID=UPI0010AEB944|nr:hypothetical protein [Polyangium aurulentum]UQA55856.1 hypothetical protein E8A73_031580 [Polyangium aurulentum]